MDLIEKAKARIPKLTLDKLLECTIFNIEIDKDDDGVLQKYVHFYGYGYCSDTSVTGNPEDVYRFISYTFFYEKLSEVLKRGFFDVEGEDGCEYKQYVADCDEAGCLETYLEYDDGETPLPIYFDELTMDIPEGCYVIIKGGE